ncbi:conserved uncharacterized protein (N-terminal fragment), partial [Ustilago hordei]
MTYQNCLLVPNLVMNLIGTKSVMHAQGKVTFENELVTVQDKHGCAIHVPTSGDGYLAAAMMIWNDRMAEPAISLTFMATASCMGNTHRTCPKANLWHHRLGHASHDSILQTQMHVKEPLELVSMDVMGPLHGTTMFAYVLIIHDAYSGMVWVQGLMSKGQAAQEAGWWFSKVHITTHWKLLEVVFDHGIKEVQV